MAIRMCLRLILFMSVVSMHTWLQVHAQGAQPDDDRVTLNNHDHLSGQISWADASGLTLKTRAVSSVKAKWSDISEVEINHTLMVDCKNCAFAGTSLTAKATISPRLVQLSADQTELWLDFRIGVIQHNLLAGNLLSIQPPTPCTNPNVFMCPEWHLAKLKFDVNVLGATQKQQTYGSSLKAVRNWNPASHGWPHERSDVELAGSYDDKRQNAQAKANITQNYDGTFQQLFFATSDDIYGAAIVDLYHNNSLGLYFQQAYGGGGGIVFGGWELDADLRFIGEHLYPPGPSVGLFGTRLSEQYDFDLSQIKKGMRVTEVGRVTPVFNRSRSWQSQGKIDLVIPFSDTIGLSITADDNYVENAPKGFRQNYFKLTVGVQYAPAKKP